MSDGGSQLAAGTVGDITDVGRIFANTNMAAASGAGLCQIWKDVDGFFTADPRIVTNARCLDEVSYEEAMELTYYGANVISAKALMPLAAKGIPGPKSIPVLFPVVCHALTTDSVIEVYGSETSGEVEYVLCVVSEDEVYVGLGSDHTDRREH